ncbi:MAG: hypothetical protein HKN76_06830 [Saprospiraceae bacterium]|nr:hypothetical protein [Saprospiraceae bacterium]
MESNVSRQESLKVVYNAILLEGDTTNYEVFIMDADGKNQRNISNNTAVDWAYHAEGDRIYFISDRDTVGGIYFLYQMSLAGTKLERLVDKPVVDSWIDTRYGGRELVVCQRSESFYSISIIDSSGSEVIELIRTDQYDVSDPVFSPEGNWIVYRSTRSGQDELWIVDEYGAYQRQITTYRDQMSSDEDAYRAGPPRWVPNTRAVSYTSKVGDNYSIFQVNIDGKEPRQITFGGGDEGWHSWSPDGKFLIYDGCENPGTNSDLFLLDLDAGQTTRLTSTGYPERGPIFVALTPSMETTK